MYSIPAAFSDFIDLNCDRCAFIQKYLNGFGIDAPVIPMEGNNHIYVKFPMSQYSGNYKVKTVIAHYDRVPNTPGANDNSASVFSLMEWAVRLFKSGAVHNVRLIFSDGEELGELGVKSQGAYSLAALFRKLNITNDDILVFDCMGRGNIPILTQTVLPKGLSHDFVDRFCELEKRVQLLMKSVCGDKWYSLPCNYSDNAGFIANGIPAVAITMLPESEIVDVARGLMPRTWALNHTMEDNLLSLDNEAFEITGRLLDKLGSILTLNNN